MQATPDWITAFAGGDIEALVRYVRDRFGVEAQPDLLLRRLGDRLPVGGPGWSEGTWAMWLKARVAELDLFAPGGVVATDLSAGTFHVGFLHLVEDEAMLGRLRGPDVPLRASPSRSKIGKTAGAIRPVDVVAYRVASPPAGPGRPGSREEADDVRGIRRAGR